VQKQNFSTAVVDGKIYVIGGSVSGVATTSVEIYDPATDTWTEGTPLQVPMSSQSSHAVNGKIYVFADGSSATTYVFDPAISKWRMRAAMPENRGTSLSAESNGLILFLWSQQFRTWTKGLVYYPESDRWLYITPMPSNTPGRNRTLAGYGGSFFLLGGWLQGIGERIYKSECYRVDVQPIGFEDLWSKITAMPTGRAYATAATVNGKIYVMGGRNSKGDLDLVEQYDPVADTWETKTPMPMPSDILQSVVANGKIYVIMSQRIYEYDPALD